METVKVLVTASIDDECLRQIAAVSPRVKLSDVRDLISAELSGDFTAQEQFDALLVKAEVIYGNRLPKNVITRAPRLKWVQTIFTGVDKLLDDSMRNSPVILTNTRGIHDTPVGEFVLQLMLMLAKQAPRCFQLKQQKQWKWFVPNLLRSKTVGIVGLGIIGQEVARLAEAFGMTVIATRRSARRAAQARYVDTVLPPEQLQQLLSASDFVVLTVPLTPETIKLIGEPQLRTMKPNAYLINVARGKIVDEEALVRALDEHWIAGAGLDVFATEPLPPESRLWQLPNVIISPHISGHMEDYNSRATELFCTNLRRYLNGEKLFNVIDKQRGY